VDAEEVPDPDIRGYYYDLGITINGEAVYGNAVTQEASTWFIYCFDDQADIYIINGSLNVHPNPGDEAHWLNSSLTGTYTPVGESATGEVVVIAL